MTLLRYLIENTTAKEPANANALSQEIGCSPVQIRREINRLRTNCYPICSNQHGYYCSDDKNELEITIDSLERRIYTQECAVHGLKKLLKTNNEV